MSHAMLLVHEALSGALFYTCFCRAVLMNGRSTAFAVRMAFYLLGLSSVVLLAAPVVSAWQTNLPTCLLVFAIVVLQGVTARYWRAGSPDHFNVCKRENGR